MDSNTSRTWAEISLSAIRHNYREIAARAGESGVMCVVKADAYGHGSVPVARSLAELGCAYLAVASIDEALKLRRGGITCPVLVMGYTAPKRTPELIQGDITQAVFDLETAEAISRIAQKSGARVRAHLKLDTGMGRLGFTAEQDGKALGALGLPGLDFEGVYSHLAVSETAGDNFTQVQISAFSSRAAALAEKSGVNFKICHCANSGAVINYSGAYIDMVRPGLALYGHYPGGDDSTLPLCPAMELKTRVAQVKELAPGETVSYGRTYTAAGRMKIAVLSIGYADGLCRLLSGKTQMLVRGRRANQIGRICMDMCMLDVTDIDGVQAGDIVTVFGRDGDEYIPASRLAEISGTITYETLCAVSARVPRVYVSTE